MSLFGFGEISFDKNISAPLKVLSDNKFSTNTLRYPSDIGDTDKSHYMVIYIRKQRNSTVQGLTETSSWINTAGATAPIGSALSNLGQLGQEIRGKIDQYTGELTAAMGQALETAKTTVASTLENIFTTQSSYLTDISKATQGVIQNSVKQAVGGSFQFMRTSLTTDAIALYMPDTLFFEYQQSYDNLSMGGEIGGWGAAGLRSTLDEYKNGGKERGEWAAKKSALMSAGQMAANEFASKAIGSNSTRLAAGGILGSVVNPLLEVIYSSPDFRRFQFEFMFYPRDKKEAIEVQRIIERLRFHQAPEFESGVQAFLVPPSEFDIRFFHNGSINPNIPTIATCVLTNMAINYAPNGFSAYEVPGEPAKLGGTGMPVAIQMTLNFQEVSYLTKSDYNEQLAVGAR